MNKSTRFQIFNKIRIDTYSVPSLYNHDHLTIDYL